MADTTPKHAAPSSGWQLQAKDIAERVVTTFLLTAGSLWAGLGLQTDIASDKIVLAGALAAAFSLALNLILTLVGAANGKTWWQDMILRCTYTYAQAWAALVIVNGSVHWHDLGPAALAALPALFGAVKGWIFSKIGDQSTAGLFALAA